MEISQKILHQNGQGLSKKRRISRSRDDVWRIGKNITGLSRPASVNALHSVPRPSFFTRVKRRFKRSKTFNGCVSTNTTQPSRVIEVKTHGSSREVVGLSFTVYRCLEPILDIILVRLGGEIRPSFHAETRKTRLDLHVCLESQFGYAIVSIYELLVISENFVGTTAS